MLSKVACPANSAHESSPQIEEDSNSDVFDMMDFMVYRIMLGMKCTTAPTLQRVLLTRVHYLVLVVTLQT